MRGRALAFVIAALLGSSAQGQPIWQPTPAPIVTAEGAGWFQAGEPVTWEGAIYVAAGARRPFSGSVMVRSGMFRGIPLYTDATLEPYSVVLIPLAGGWMQPYERRAFVVEPETRQAAVSPSFGPALAFAPATETGPADEPQATDEGTRTPVLTVQPTTGRLLSSPPRPVTTVIPPTGANTIWVSWNDKRWVAAKASIAYDAATLDEIGSYHGWTVYARKSKTGAPETIYIPSAAGRLSAYVLESRSRE